MVGYWPDPQISDKARDDSSSLSKNFVNYDRTKFYNIGPRGLYYKTFYAVIYGFS